MLGDISISKKCCVHQEYDAPLQKKQKAATSVQSFHENTKYAEITGYQMQAGW
jgi:hypothetical protein